MTQTQAQSRTGTIAPSLIERFGHRAIMPGDPRFEAARRTWNGSIDKQPAAIFRCAGPEAVAAAIRGAREGGLPVSVRGGGHQIAGTAIVEAGLVIDLSPMRQADVDLAAGTATAGGGALLGDLDRPCTRYGVVVPAGVVSHTGVAGLALGGGIGWLCRSRGLTCDSLVSVTVVDASGQILIVSADEHPDLFWALHGGGGNFGVATEMTFRTAPIGLVTYGIRIVPLSEAESSLQVLHGIEDDLPNELQVVVRLQRFAGYDIDAGPLDEPCLTVEWLWSGDVGEADRIAGLMNLGGGTETIRQRRFITIQSQQDHRFPHGDHYYLKPGHLEGFGPETVRTLLNAIADAPPGDPQIEIMRLGGAIGDIDEDATAFPRRSARWAVNVQSRYQDAADAADQAAWARAAHAGLTRDDHSAYVNFVTPGQVSLEDVYGQQKLVRLWDVKRRYDPDDVFATGVHIPPAES